MKWGLKQSYSPFQEFSNHISHTTFTRINQGDFLFLVVGNQIWLPTFLLVITCVLSTQMSHESPFQTSALQELSNGIMNISIQWVFYPCNRSKNLGVHRKSNSQSGSSFWSVGVQSLTLSYIPRSMKCESLTSLLARTFISPCFGHEPKARVARPKNNWRFKTLNSPKP